MPPSNDSPRTAELDIHPLSVDPAAMQNWSKSQGLPLRILLAGVRVLPRGRGVVTRWFGRHLMRKMKRSIRMPGGEWVAIDPHNLEVYMLNAFGVDRNVDVVLRAINTILAGSASSAQTPGAKPTVFYDIGANAGFVTLAVARKFGAAVRVVAFEPQPVLAERIAISATLNHFDQVQVFSVLLGDRRGEMDLYVPTLGVMASTVWWDKQTPGVQSVRRPMERLDALVAANHLDAPTLIKIDVEGAERMVLEGATGLLASAKPLLLFESFADTAEERAERAKIISLIASAAPYDFYFVSPDGFKPMQQDSGADSDDILAAPRDWTPPPLMELP